MGDVCPYILTRNDLFASLGGWNVSPVFFIFTLLSKPLVALKFILHTSGSVEHVNLKTNTNINNLTMYT